MLKATLIIWFIGAGDVTRPVVVGSYLSFKSCEVAAQIWEQEHHAQAVCIPRAIQ